MIMFIELALLTGLMTCLLVSVLLGFKARNLERMETELDVWRTDVKGIAKDYLERTSLARELLRGSKSREAVEAAHYALSYACGCDGEGERCGRCNMVHWLGMPEQQRPQPRGYSRAPTPTATRMGVGPQAPTTFADVLRAEDAMNQGDEELASVLAYPDPAPTCDVPSSFDSPSTCSSSCDSPSTPFGE